MTDDLSTRSCTPCRGGSPPLTHAEATRYLAQVPDWTLVEDGARIERRFSFGNFRDAMNFVVAVGELAETQGHHPDVAFGWGWASISWQTKKIGGLHDNDFVMAAKTDRLVAG
ncbi:4a-hydroxytetrahydrobiopterin dehydratase [Aromatoleum sp.]|uniref:4a-hydroxytetrahydrobiopterin dehydratase n=1 Tax=Aromatoleum sp. TaxID=2307007 RepID=UPI002FCC7499